MSNPHCIKNQWTPENQCLMNYHINIELNGFHIYNFLYSTFSNEQHSLPGLANFFKQQSDKKLHDARELIQYQNTRGGTVELNSIIKPNLLFLNEPSDKSMTYNAFKYLVEGIEGECNSFLNMHDQTQDLLLKDFIKSFLKKNLEMLHNFKIKLKQVELLDNNTFALYQFDKDLLSQVI